MAGLVRRATISFQVANAAALVPCHLLCSSAPTLRRSLVRLPAQADQADRAQLRCLCLIRATTTAALDISACLCWESWRQALKALVRVPCCSLATHLCSFSLQASINL